MSKCLKAGTTDPGFTLVEVLVSLGTMAIGFVILMGLHYASIRMEWSDSRRTEAIEIARTNLELLRDQDNRATCPRSPPLLSPYTCSVNTQTPASGTTQVTVTVEWKERVKMTEGSRSFLPNEAKPRVELSTIFNNAHHIRP